MEKIERPYLNVTFYHFCELTELEELRERFRRVCSPLQMRGTITLAPEGMNVFVAGTRESIAIFKNFVESEFQRSDFNYKESYSKHIPYRRLLFKIKKELIPLGMWDIKPHYFTGHHLDPETLKQWLDSKRELTLLDVRNNYEMDYGHFQDAKDLNLSNFRSFAQRAERLGEEAKKKPLVMYCTGGIRCEKASAYLIQKAGFEEVYQLNGGILNYFKKCGDAYYQGDCFVFDDRVAVTPSLDEVSAELESFHKTDVKGS